MRLDLVKILGVSKSVASVTVNGKDYHDYLYNFLDQVCNLNKFYMRKTSQFYYHVKIDFTYLWS